MDGCGGGLGKLLFWTASPHFPPGNSELGPIMNKAYSLDIRRQLYKKYDAVGLTKVVAFS